MIDEKIERAREQCKRMTDDELIIETHKWVAHSDAHIAAKLELESRKRQSTLKKEKNGSIVLSTTSIWAEIESEYGISKKGFGRKINFVKDPFCRKVIFRDVEQAYILAQNRLSKPAVILAGAVIEELLRQYLNHKKVKPVKRTFDEYIKACQKYNILKSAIHNLSNAVRQFRNIVHIAAEKDKKDTISTAIAKGAVASIFTVASNF